MNPPPGFLKVSMSDVLALNMQFVILRFVQSAIANDAFQAANSSSVAFPLSFAFWISSSRAARAKS